MIVQPVQRWLRHLLATLRAPHPEQHECRQQTALQDFLYVIDRRHVRSADWNDEPQLVDETVTTLGLVLQQPGRNACHGAAAEILQRIGPAAQAAIPELLCRLRRSSWVGFERLRLRYVETLAAIAPSHRHVVEHFLDILEEEPPEPPREADDELDECVEGDAHDFTVATRIAVAEALARGDDTVLAVLQHHLDLLRAIMDDDDHEDDEDDEGERYRVRLWVALTLWRACGWILRNRLGQDRGFVETVRFQALAFITEPGSLLHDRPVVRTQAIRLVRRVGRSAYEEVGDLLGAAAFDMDEGVRREATLALTHMQSSPAEALDLLIHEFHIRQRTPSELCPLYQRTPYELRHLGPTVLELGPESLETVVRAVLPWEDVWLALVHSLGPSMIDCLIAILKKGGTGTSGRIVQAIRRVAKEAPALLEAQQAEVVDALRSLLTRSNPELGVDTAMVLWDLTKDQAAILCLASVVQDRCGKRDIRLTAIQALGAIGRDAAAAIPILRQVANDEQDDRLVREAARMAIRRIDLPQENDC